MRATLCTSRGFSWLVLAGAIGLCAATPPAALAIDGNTRLDGYRGIWFNLGQENEYGPKYSGGLGTYTANHVPICIYREEVNKTFFVYGGIDDASGDLLIMASYYDHTNCQVPRPTVVYHKVGINDPHDNGALLIDRQGYLWVFISGRANARVGFIYRSVEPYSTDAFQHVMDYDAKYPQPWYVDTGAGQPAFVYLFTRYTGGRELYWSRSTDGVNWTPGAKFVGFEGHYQTSALWNGKIGTAFNFHPGGSVDKRTNLYYLQTTNLGDTWTTVDGTPVATPLNNKANPALVVDYQAQGLLCYINDTNFDAQGNPFIIYETSHNYAAGPDGSPRVWHLARWDGQQWHISDITESDHNYDVGSLWVEGSQLRIIAPTVDGPQVWGAGGEVALWTSLDLGQTWSKVRDLTSGSVYNHSYVRRPINGRDPFFAMWADGHSFTRSESRLYFCNRAGTHVWRLPQTMSGEFARPALVTDFGSTSASPRWRSRFETTAIGTAADGDTMMEVRNAVGSPGQVGGADPVYYAAYGQPATGVAPGAGAGSLCASLPDNRGTGINSQVASNAGNLQNAITMEGFFRTPESAVITSPTYVGRRLVSQKRSDNEGESRLAVGLHGGTAAPTEGLLDYEGFNYTGTVIHDQAGGLGWSGGWVNSNGDFNHLTNDGVSLDSNAFPFAPVGSRISGVGGAAARNLSRAINGSDEGSVMYFSTLYRRGATTAGSSDIQFQFQNSALTTGFRVGNGSNGKFFVGMGSVTAELVYGPDVQPDTVYFLVAKVVTSASGLDQAFLNIYGPDDTVPATEPGTWQLTASKAITSSLTRLRINIGAGNTNGQIDEMRIGSTYEAVTDPDAPIASTGVAANRLSVFWQDVDAVNHMETGITAIQPDRWYHFALVYDGAFVKWFLDGNLEGQFAATNLVSAGSAPLAIGNNRTSGVTDRGFYGLLDEIRISDQALAPESFLLNGGSCGAACGASGGSVVWCSGFETSPGAAVVHEQADTGVCGAIANAYGRSGSAAGSTPLVYVQYDQPGAGTAPHPEAGGFAISLPNDRTVAIDTGLASNAGNLNQAATFEGFFRSAESSPIVSPDSIGRRLITQKRDSNTDSRLAIGLHSSGGSNTLAALWKNQAGATQTVPGSTAVQANRWYHFALVYDGLEIRWYLDGHLEGTIAATDLISAGAAPITIGNRRADGVADRGFFGMIDEVRIVDRALTPSQFLANTGSGPDEPCLPGCSRPFADADSDGDVDQADFGVLQTCFSIGAEVLPECHCFDRAGDEQIDLIDFEEFMNCATGPSVQWSPLQTPECIP